MFINPLKCLTNRHPCVDCGIQNTWMYVSNANNEVAIATIDLIGYSHPKARYFLLLRQKKVSKEKAARLPLLPALLGFVGANESKAMLLSNVNNY